MSTKRVSLVLLTLFVSLFIIQFASAAIDWSNNPIYNAFSTGDLANTSNLMFVKFLLGVLVFLIVLGVIKYIPGLSSVGYKKDKENKVEDKPSFWGILASAIIAFLAVAFFKLDEVFALLQSYGAMGFSIAFVIPLIILIFWSIEIAKMNSDEPSVTNVVSYLLIWVVFGIYALVKLVSCLNGDVPEGVSYTYALWVTLIMLILCFVMLAIRSVLFNYVTNVTETTAEDSVKKKGASVNRAIKFLSGVDESAQQ